MTDMLRLTGVSKSFTLHNQGGVRLPVLAGAHLRVAAGECVALTGPSGAGKSTLMRLIYGNYLTDVGSIEVRHDGGWIDLAGADPRAVLAVRRRTLGYVSQFLRVVPRVATRDVVAEPRIALGEAPADARATAESLLARLNLPSALWDLPPATFSGGEQQRVNIARGFAHPYPVLLLDEPTASLDGANRRVVLDLIEEAKDRGAAIVGIFHDADARGAVCTREYEIAPLDRAA
ncbi:MAG: phosphonate C-P lyase system protein PhnL [Marivibrio sp.]|uniref:phosphonate C-P lyase system protein PhnL n=1 Tax=Marivibrio sp. TaxID=2039719 RepID=UPI0032EAD714